MHLVHFEYFYREERELVLHILDESGEKLEEMSGEEKRGEVIWREKCPSLKKLIEYSNQTKKLTL